MYNYIGDDFLMLKREDVLKAQFAISLDSPEREGEIEQFLSLLRPILVSQIRRKGITESEEDFQDLLLYLQEECLARLVDYDSSKSAPSTFFYMVARSAISRYIRFVSRGRGLSSLQEVESWASPSPSIPFGIDMDDPETLLLYRWRVDRESIRSLAQEQGCSVRSLRRRLRSLESKIREQA